MKTSGNNWSNYILKAMLAIGDSYLLTTGQYHYSYPEKVDPILESLPTANFKKQLPEKLFAPHQKCLA